MISHDFLMDLSPPPTSGANPFISELPSLWERVESGFKCLEPWRGDVHTFLGILHLQRDVRES